MTSPAKAGVFFCLSAEFHFHLGESDFIIIVAVFAVSMMFARCNEEEAESLNEKVKFELHFSFHVLQG